MNRDRVLAALLACLVAPTAAQAETEQAVQTALWAKEQAIYGGRAVGDLSAYTQALAPGYVSWPPGNPTPMGAALFKENAAKRPAQSQEKLAMHYCGLALNGDTAIIYYKTHMTMSATGEVVDRRYNVTHTWLKRDGEWRILGGMARLASDVPATGPADPSASPECGAPD